MSDNSNGENQEQENEEQSFAELFESYTSGMQDNLQVGDRILAEIIAIGRESLFLDTGTKVDGVVERAELLDETGNLPYEEGDQIELYVVAIDEHEIRLSKAISGIGGLALLRDAYENSIPVEGKISATCKGGFNVNLLQRRAFCPVSQMDVNYIESPEDYVGQTHEFLITQLEEGGKNIVVSRRKLMAQAIEKEKKNFFNTLKEDDVLEGRVTRIMPYGVFVELITGVEGMVHISEMSWSRVEKAEEMVRVNETVTVRVTGIEDGDKSNQKKISLSMKRIDPDPWDTVTKAFSPGDKVTGKVTRCLKFGVFVEIAPGIEGLVHISEMSYLKRVTHPEDLVAPGEAVSVLIREIDEKNRRLSLSMRDAQGDPWLDISEKFKAGQIVTGTLEKKEKFGYFVSLAPGITGLLPKSNMNSTSRPGHLEQLKEGDDFPVTIAEILPLDRKITLAPGDAADMEDWKTFSAPTTPAPMSDLAEKLQQAMTDKKRKDRK